LDFDDAFTHYINVVNVRGAVYLIDSQFGPETNPPMIVTSIMRQGDSSVMRRFLVPQIRAWAQSLNHPLAQRLLQRIEKGELQATDVLMERLIDISFLITRLGADGSGAVRDDLPPIIAPIYRKAQPKQLSNPPFDAPPER
jgi:hypothetical protein